MVHYCMGGIPTKWKGQVLNVDEQFGKARMVDELYVTEEVACVSTHGAKRLWSNYLLEIVVFGREGGSSRNGGETEETYLHSETMAGWTQQQA